MSVHLLEKRDPLERAFKLAFSLFIGSIAFSIAGSLLLRVFPSTLAIFGPYYPQLVKGPTWIYMALLPILPVLLYSRSLGAPLMAFFVLWGSFVGGMSELMGTSTGIPFGDYAYGMWLGPKLLDHVPYFIPPSWFAMSIISLDLARRLGTRRWERILIATLFMVLWDVSLDPAMSRAFTFWSYPDGGFYYGMPLSNWGGWFVVSLVIMLGYEYLGGGLPDSNRWAPWIYALNCIFPLSICLLQGLYGAFFIGAVATALPLLVLWGRGALADVPLPFSR